MNCFWEIWLIWHLKHVHILGLSEHNLKFLHSFFYFLTLIALLDTEICQTTANTAQNYSNKAIYCNKHSNKFIRNLLRSLRLISLSTISVHISSILFPSHVHFTWHLVSILYIWRGRVNLKAKFRLVVLIIVHILIN